MPKTMVATALLVVLLNKYKPIERIPMVGNFAPELELASGAVGLWFAHSKKLDNWMLKAAIAALFIDGAIKTVNKYIK